jgi:hypothetical protein
MCCRLVVLAAAFVFAAAAACSGPGSGAKPQYPRRKPGCPLTVYHGLPTGPWDDIGVAEVGCYIDESEAFCLARLRNEACRMGGDIIYNVPRKPLRPMERAKIYRAVVAHSKDAKQASEDAPEPADAGSGPVVPLPKSEPAPAPAAPADAGTQ